MRFWSKQAPKTPLLLLAVAEGGALFLSVYIAALLVVGGTVGLQQYIPQAVTVVGVMLLSLIATGLYQFHKRINFTEIIARIVVGLAIGSFVMLAAYIALPMLTLQPRIAVIALACALLLLLLLRYGFMQLVDESVFRRRTLIYGAGERTLPISALRRRADRRGFKIVGQVPAPGDLSVNECENLIESEASLLTIARQQKADEIVVAMDDRRGNLPVNDLLDCKLVGIEVIDLLEFLERETGKIRIDLVKPGWLIFSPQFLITRSRRALKRIADLILGTLALVLLCPVMAVIFLAIKFCDGWDKPIIYRQRRVGFRGQEFDLLKFRSMIVDAENGSGAVWAQQNDPRVTRVGALLRQCRFDELPQIFNILKGEMSIVGPRPERPQFVRELEQRIPYYTERHAVMPGVTGWAQLNFKYGASEDDAIEKLQYDLYYVKNHNLILDLMIILQTTEIVLWRIGAR